MKITGEHRHWIEAQARAVGFETAGMVAVPEPGSPSAASTDHRFAEWIAAGNAGEMGWLQRRDESGSLVRSDLRRSLPWARSVVVCAANYNSAGPRSIDDYPVGSGWIARYAWSGRRAPASAMGEPADDDRLTGSDYHDVLMEPLRELERRVRGRYTAAGEIETRPYVDTGPILERDFAQAAGVGWIGRNCCVIHQGLGSWLLLAVLVTSLELEDEARPAVAADRCGSCRRCIDACPTGALDGSGLDGADRSMDATRCIAYLTIEKKGDVPEELRAGMGRQVFGCDICQEVCPWNRRAPVTTNPWFPTRGELVNPTLEDLAALDGPAFNQMFRGSPLERTRRRRVQRNVALAMGNSGDHSHRERLQGWAAGEDAMLAEAARWSLQRLTEEPPAGRMEADPADRNRSEPDVPDAPDARPDPTGHRDTADTEPAAGACGC